MSIDRNQLAQTLGAICWENGVLFCPLWDFDYHFFSGTTPLALLSGIQNYLKLPIVIFITEHNGYYILGAFVFNEVVLFDFIQEHTTKFIDLYKLKGKNLLVNRDHIRFSCEGYQLITAALSVQLLKHILQMDKNVFYKQFQKLFLPNNIESATYENIISEEKFFYFADFSGLMPDKFFEQVVIEDSVRSLHLTNSNVGNGSVIPDLVYMLYLENAYECIRHATKELEKQKNSTAFQLQKNINKIYAKFGVSTLQELKLHFQNDCSLSNLKELLLEVGDLRRSIVCFKPKGHERSIYYLLEINNPLLADQFSSEKYTQIVDHYANIHFQYLLRDTASKNFSLRQKRKRVRVRLWKPDHGAKQVGHASLETYVGGPNGRGFYVSFWPTNSNDTEYDSSAYLVKKFKNGALRTLNYDCIIKGKPCDKHFDLHGLQVDEINNYISTLLNSNVMLNWNIRGSSFLSPNNSRNCVSLVMSLLSKGNINELYKLRIDSEWNTDYGKYTLKPFISNKVQTLCYFFCVLTLLYLAITIFFSGENHYLILMPLMLLIFPYYLGNYLGNPELYYSSVNSISKIINKAVSSEEKLLINHGTTENSSSSSEPQLMMTNQVNDNNQFFFFKCSKKFDRADHINTNTSMAPCKVINRYEKR